MKIFLLIFLLFIAFSFLWAGIYIIIAWKDKLQAALGLLFIFFLSAAISIFLGVEAFILVLLIIDAGASWFLFLFVTTLLNTRVLHYKNLSWARYLQLFMLCSISFLTHLYFCLCLIFKLIFAIEKFNCSFNFCNLLTENAYLLYKFIPIFIRFLDFFFFYLSLLILLLMIILLIVQIVIFVLARFR